MSVLGGADVLLDGSFQHGTPEGYAAGCRGSGCPAGRDHGFSCSRAVIAERGDFRYKKLRAAGLGPAEMADALNIGSKPPAGASGVSRPSRPAEPIRRPERVAEVTARTINRPTPTASAASIAVPVVGRDTEQQLNTLTEPTREEPVMPKPTSPAAPVSPPAATDLETAWEEAEAALSKLSAASGDLLTVLREINQQQATELAGLRALVAQHEADGRLVRAFAAALTQIKQTSTDQGA